MFPVTVWCFGRQYWCFGLTTTESRFILTSNEKLYLKKCLAFNCSAQTLKPREEVARNHFSYAPISSFYRPSSLNSSLEFASLHNIYAACVNDIYYMDLDFLNKPFLLELRSSESFLIEFLLELSSIRTKTTIYCFYHDKACRQKHVCL